MGKKAFIWHIRQALGRRTIIADTKKPNIVIFGRQYRRCAQGDAKLQVITVAIRAAPWPNKEGSDRADRCGR
jgi:hypothetical protein